MAVMLPATYSSTNESDAERATFARLAGGPESWTVLHSVGLTRHSRKPWAEADFVLISPEGVFVLEVKGGSVKRAGREWWTNASKLKESPFDQAAGAAAALYEDLAAHVPAVRSSVVGAGVVLPDVSFKASATDIETALVYDADDVERPIVDYHRRLVEYWSQRIPGARRGAMRPLSPQDTRAVIDRIAGDFDLVRSLRGEVADITTQMIRLTTRQAETFQGLEENPRVLVRGGAGTGKTLIAVAEAKRLAREGQHVLFLCHSNALRDYIARAFAGTDLVEARTFQNLCGDLMAMGGVPDPRTPRMRGNEYWELERPMAALEALMAMERPPSWDALIIDEAQDLMTGPAKDVLDVVVRGGWEQGAWRVFLDPQQDVFAVGNREVVETLAAHGLRFRLTMNCRNTSQIARDTAIASGRRLTETLPIEGRQPVWLRYSSAKEQRKLAADQLRAWLESGVRPEQIAILSPRRRDNSVFADGLPPGVPARLVDGPLVAPEEHPKAIQFSTIAAFKGLEADAVLILDADVGDTGRAETVYVGMSRARILLAVLRSTRSDSRWEELQEDFGRRLLEASLHR